MVLLVAVAAYAASPALHARWGVAEGLPVDGISDVVVSSDGFVWVATWDGLVRFDGTRFEAVAPEGPWPSRRIVQVREAPDGAVWAQTEPGTLVRVDPSGAVAVFDVGPMRSASPMVLDEAGRWLIASDTGLHRVDAHGAIRISEAHVGDLAVAADGRVWGLTDGGDLFRVEGDELVPWPLTGGPSGGGQLEAAAGGWWIGTPSGIWRVVDHEAAPIGSGGAPWTPEVRALAPADEGLWVGTHEGLFLWNEGLAAPIAPEDVDRTPRLGLHEEDAFGHSWVASAHVVLRDEAECWKVMYVVDSIEYDEVLDVLDLREGLRAELRAKGIVRTQDLLRSLGLSFPSDLHGRTAADEHPEHAEVLAALRAWDARRNVYPKAAAPLVEEPSEDDLELA